MTDATTPPFRLDGKAAAITGAGSGIGRAIAERFAGQGAKVAVLDSREVAVDIVEWSAARDRHDRYGIEAVPLVVVADARGVVRAAFVGPVTAQDLWSAVAECREPGSTPGPDGCTGSARVV